MTNYNQNIGDLFTITFCSSWPMCNETGQFVRNVKNNEIVMLLEYRPPPHVIPSYSSNSQGIAKVLCAEGCIGYVPIKFLKIIRKENNMNIKDIQIGGLHSILCYSYDKKLYETEVICE